MKHQAMPPHAVQGHPFDAFLDALADRLAARLAPSVGPSPTRYATAKDNPLGSSRAFLDAARRGDFSSFKRGREVVARWEDVETYVESRPRPLRARPHDPDADDRALLESSGIELAKRGSR